MLCSSAFHSSFFLLRTRHQSCSMTVTTTSDMVEAEVQKPAAVHNAQPKAIANMQLPAELYSKSTSSGSETKAQQEDALRLRGGYSPYPSPYSSWYQCQTAPCYCYSNSAGCSGCIVSLFLTPLVWLSGTVLGVCNCLTCGAAREGCSCQSYL